VADDIDPTLVEAINNIGATILNQENRVYVIQHALSGPEAMNWLDTYNRAVANDDKAMKEMISFLWEYASQIHAMVELPDEEIEDFNASQRNFLAGEHEDGDDDGDW